MKINSIASMLNLARKVKQGVTFIVNFGLQISISVNV
jgi:hypothetical protein